VQIRPRSCGRVGESEFVANPVEEVDLGHGQETHPSDVHAKNQRIDCGGDSDAAQKRPIASESDN
jgi:hypothetical protein